MFRIRPENFWSLLLAAAALSLAPLSVVAQEKAQNEMPDEWAPWKDPTNPDVVILSEDKDAFYARRDRSNDPQREPGLTNPQRYAAGLVQYGFPTFLGAPMAFTMEDLMAGNVDVALVGLAISDQAVPGANFAANKMRVLTDWMSFPAGGTNNMLGVDYGKLVIADYGNVGVNLITDNQRNVEEVHKVVAEILEADAIPIGIGGTHIQTYGFHTALAQKYGPKTFATLHIDAHYDTYLYGFGRFVHNGNFLKVAIENGLINGDELIQVGLRSTLR